MSAANDEMLEPSADEIRAARVTTYVVGEMSPEDAQAFERELAGDPALASEVEEVRSMTNKLSSELGRDVPPLRAVQRVVLDSAPSRPRRSRLGFWFASLAWAAALGGVAVLGLSQQRSSPASFDGDNIAAPPMPLEAQAEPRRGDGRATGPAAKRPAGLDAANDGSMAPKALDSKLRIPPRGPKAGAKPVERLYENPFVLTSADARSTFSIDVDTASYSIMRSYLTRGESPPADTVRIEELINYFSYTYPKPDGVHPFSVNVDVAAAPWAPSHRLVRVGLLGKDVKLEDHEGANLVFLVDSSGSMNAPNKLPLLKESLKLLLPKLSDRDSVSIVAYAGGAGLVLPATPGDQHDKIQAALDRLAAGGSTNGGEGIELAYAVARDHFIKGGVNRVILCTDGDFNVGVTNQDALVTLVKDKAASGVFLSVLGFGMGNLKDGTLEKIADKGNGNYAYVDSLAEGRKVLAEGLGTLVTIAKDVKIQVAFDPARVESFRLIGYENRVLSHRDFNDDKKDAGELGSAHTVTALYEVVPKLGAARGDMLTVQLRYKDPDGTDSKLIEAGAPETSGDGASSDFKFAAGVAAFGMLLRDSAHKGAANWDMVATLLGAGVESDSTGRRKELLDLVATAKALSGR